MKKYLLYIAILLFPIYVIAQTTSPIQDTLYNPTDTVSSGSTVNGTLTIVSSSMDVNNKIVVKTLSPIKIINGVLNFNLAPNDTANNINSYYTANFAITELNNPKVSTNYSEKWSVPTSASPLTLHQIRINTVVGPAYFPIPANQLVSGAESQIFVTKNGVSKWDYFAFSQLPTPPNSGTYCIQSTNGTINWGVCNGSSSISWSNLVNAQWTGLTNTQWTGMIN